MSLKTIVTGAQPTGAFHLGNYFGAIRNWTRLQEEFNCYFFLADLHAITVQQEPAKLRKNTLETVAQYLACGLDPERACIFVQSWIKGHADLAWVLACLSSVGQLQRMTQFKAKTQGKSFLGSGILYYPILMAADILMYNADVVPVGDDQKQHLELTRDLAMRFNQTYSPTFNVPEPYILETGARIYSLQDPCRKMSKSDSNTKGTVFLFEPIDSVRKKFKSAVTDSGSGIYKSKEKPGISNLLEILSATTGSPVKSLEAEHGNKSYADFKETVAEAVIEHLKPIQERYDAIKADKAMLMEVLQKGAGKAQKAANKTLSKVYRKVGFLQQSR